MKDLFPSLDTSGPFLTFTLETEQQQELIQTYTEILKTLILLLSLVQSWYPLWPVKR